MARVDRAARWVRMPPEWVYRALVDPELLVRWLPPRGARATIDAFDARAGGPFALTLTFDAAEGAQGKSTSNTDVVKGRFLALRPHTHVSQAFTFDSPDPAFAGTMTMTWTLEPDRGGTMLFVTAENVPAGISAEDHERGMASSLENLAALAEDTRRAR